MSVRPFNWRDILTLHRYRQKSVFLDSVLLLTRGPLLVQGALVSYLAPGMGVTTLVRQGEPPERQPVIGQFIHGIGSQFAHLTFLTPQERLGSNHFTELLDHMVTISGERGALRLLADVDESSAAFETLRRDGFATFSRQRIWRLDLPAGSAGRSGSWRSARSGDQHAIRTLYNNLVPGLVQQVEPYTREQPRGVVYYQGDQLLAYVDLKNGHRGVWVQPFFHPDIDGLSDLILDLFQHIPNRSSRPAYICVRSYQGWLEATVEALGAQAGPRQALMVRHLAGRQKAEQSFALSALDGGSPEISAPIVRSESNHL
jgi:hypothetical protein